MDRDGCLKSTTQFSNICGDSPINNKIIFFNGNDSHFYGHTLLHMYQWNIQPFILKAGDYVNDQPNDNGPNAKLKSLYNEMKSAWMLKYSMTKFLPHHMESILVEEWDTFKVSYKKLIRDSFVKTKPPPPPQPSQLNHEYPGIHCLHSRIFWIQGWRNQQYITPHICTYWVTRNQEWRSYGCSLRKGWSTIINQHCHPSCSAFRCEATNRHPYSINEKRMYDDNAAKEG